MNIRVCPYCGGNITEGMVVEKGVKSYDGHYRCLGCRIIWYSDGKVSYWDKRFKWHGIPEGILLVVKEERLE